MKLWQCFQSVKKLREEASILALLEADAHQPTVDDWRQDNTRAEAVTCLHCVPFGCQVAHFLMELANIGIQQGFKVGIVSNSVDVVVASRAADCPWHHLGFMFVDEMELANIRIQQGFKA